jgi:hypothetical protein
METCVGARSRRLVPRAPVSSVGNYFVPGTTFNPSKVVHGIKRLNLIFVFSSPILEETFADTA